MGKCPILFRHNSDIKLNRSVLIFAGIQSQYNEQRKPSDSGSNNVNAANITTQTQPVVQPSSQLQSVQQPEREQRQHAKPQTNDRSESAARSNAREARSTGTRRKD